VLKPGPAFPDRPTSIAEPSTRRSVDDETTAAARLLTMPSALAELSLDEARHVIGYTRRCDFEAGTTVIMQGEHEVTDFMFLVLAGDVTIESIVVSRANPTVMSVLGPGNLVGEMGLLDGAPRAASCVASTDVVAAVLTRGALARLIHDDPAIGAKLLIAVSQRLAARLRESGQKLRAYTQLARAMQDEIESLAPAVAAAAVAAGSAAAEAANAEGIAKAAADAAATATPAATPAASRSGRFERGEEPLAVAARAVA
jgi:CRP/FNR family transcriptional regulator, cyclic AMP receptor protein